MSDSLIPKRERNTHFQRLLFLIDIANWILLHNTSENLYILHRQSTAIHDVQVNSNPDMYETSKVIQNDWWADVVVEKKCKSLWSTAPHEGRPIGFKYVIKPPHSGVGKCFNRPQSYKPLIYTYGLINTDHNSKHAGCSQHFKRASSRIIKIRSFYTPLRHYDDDSVPYIFIYFICFTCLCTYILFTSALIWAIYFPLLREEKVGPDLLDHRAAYVCVSLLSTFETVRWFSWNLVWMLRY
jgi:hypothetical protein